MKFKYQLLVNTILLIFSLILFDQAKVQKDLYVMYSEDHSLFKIGISNDVYRRVSEVRRSTGGQVEVLKIYPKMAYIERELHNTFIDSRIMFIDRKGTTVTEWFCLSNQEVMKLDSIVMNRRIQDEFCHLNTCE